MIDPVRSTRDIIVQTRDWSAASKFYGETLGLPVAYEGDGLVGFETGAFLLYVEEGDLPGPVLEFLVPDVEAAKHRLLAAGCVMVDEDPGVPRCYLRDAFGLVFNLGKSVP